MGFFDDMSVLAGKGMNAVDRKTKSLKLQAELNRVSHEKGSALAELGRMVYARKGKNEAVLATYGQQIQLVRDLELQEANLREQIAVLQGNSNITMQAPPEQEVFATYCTACGAGVPEGSLFCVACGTRLEVPEQQACETSPEAPEQQACESETSPEVPEAPEQRKACPSCGTALEDDSLFCHECGQRIESDSKD